MNMRNIYSVHCSVNCWEILTVPENSWRKGLKKVDLFHLSQLQPLERCVDEIKNKKMSKIANRNKKTILLLRTSNIQFFMCLGAGEGWSKLYYGGWGKYFVQAYWYFSSAEKLGLLITTLWWYVVTLGFLKHNVTLGLFRVSVHLIYSGGLMSWQKLPLGQKQNYGILEVRWV